ncbi:MAG TPA: class I SAM-dependent methyltransferase, partial [Microthrixaceae bacterium]|nr:class I SAM-dependent methyltransferase [Microthrixaceae bacterium]
MADPGVMVQGGFASAASERRPVGGPFGRELIGFLKDQLSPHVPILELGAGTGLLTGQLHRARLDVLAIEPEADSLAQLRRSLPAVPALHAELDNLPVRDMSVGAVVIVTDGPVESLAHDARRVLGAQGLLVLLNRDARGA